MTARSIMIGGKDKKKIRDRTPIEFRDLLILIAQSVHRSPETLTPSPENERVGAAAEALVASGCVAPVMVPSRAGANNPELARDRDASASQTAPSSRAETPAGAV